METLLWARVMIVLIGSAVLAPRGDTLENRLFRYVVTIVLTAFSIRVLIDLVSGGA